MIIILTIFLEQYFQLKKINVWNPTFQGSIFLSNFFFSMDEISKIYIAHGKFFQACAPTSLGRKS